MADVTVKSIEEMESIWGGSFVRARASLGASSFGMNIWNIPPNWESTGSTTTSIRRPMTARKRSTRC